MQPTAGPDYAVVYIDGVRMGGLETWQVKGEDGLR